MNGRYSSALKRTVGVLLLTALALILFQARIRKQMQDFDVYRQAAIRATRAEPLYRAEDGHYQFKYLPVFAVAMAPFGRLSETTARMSWYVLSVALLVMLVRWSVSLLPERRVSFQLLATLVVVLMAKFYGHELTLGQVNILFGVLLVAAIRALDLEHPALAGALVAAAVFIKPYGIIFAPWVMVIAGRRAILSFASFMAAGFLVPSLIYGWSRNLNLLTEWYRTVTGTTVSNLGGSDNISFASMWMKWIGTSQTAVVLATISGAAALGLAGWVWRRRRDIRSPNYLECALLLLLIPLLSPQGWDYVLLLATPAVACLIDRLREMNRTWQWVTGAALIVMGLSIFDLMGRALYARFMATSAVTVCAAVLALALANLRWHRLA